MHSNLHAVLGKNWGLFRTLVYKIQFNKRDFHRISFHKNELFTFLQLLLIGIKICNLPRKQAQKKLRLQLKKKEF